MSLARVSTTLRDPNDSTADVWAPRSSLFEDLPLARLQRLRLAERTGTDQAGDNGDRTSASSIAQESTESATPPAHLASRWHVQRPIAAAPLGSQSIAEWQGMVTEVGDDYFFAELRGLSGSGVHGSLEEARLPIEEVRTEDRELLEPGAFFRLCIKRDHTAQGSLRRYSEVVFRRMPAYRRQDLEAARERARELARELRVE